MDKMLMVESELQALETVTAIMKKDAGQKKVRRWRHVICN